MSRAVVVQVVHLIAVTVDITPVTESVAVEVGLNSTRAVAEPA